MEIHRIEVKQKISQSQESYVERESQKNNFGFCSYPVTYRLTYFANKN